LENLTKNKKKEKKMTHSGGQDVKLFCVCERARTLRCDCGERTPLQPETFFEKIYTKKRREIPRLPLSFSLHTQVCVCVAAVCVEREGRAALEVGEAAAAAVVAGGTTSGGTVLEKGRRVVWCVLRLV
jgi:hypothetical protein